MNREYATATGGGLSPSSPRVGGKLPLLATALGVMLALVVLSSSPAFAPGDNHSCGVSEYGASTAQVIPTADEKKILQVIRAAASPSVLRSDARLALAARRYAQSVAEVASMPAVQVHEGYLLHTIQRHGAVDPHPIAFEAVLSSTSPASIRHWYRDIAQYWKPTHVGVGVSSRITEGRIEHRLVLILVSRHLTLSHAPRRIAVGSRFRLRLRLAPHLSRPRLFVMTPNGQVSEFRLPLSGRQIRFSAFKLMHRGRYTMELLATGKLGPEVLGLFPVYVGQRGPILPSYILGDGGQAPTSVSLAEAYFLKLVQGERRRHGLQPLTIHAKLQTIARRHSLDMAKNRFFGHYSPRRGTLRHRLDGQRVHYLTCRENISSGISPYRMHLRLLDSPSHRVTMLDPTLTHVGLGVAISVVNGQRVYTLTQNFARLESP